MATGLGCASVLLQTQLGVGGVFAAVGAGIRSSPSFQKALEGASWEPGLRAAAAAVAPAPLLAAHALLQAHAAVPDALTRIGLLVSTAAVVVGAVVALAGGVMQDCGKAAKLDRAVGAVRAYGRALLIFGAMPAGTQLMCASILLRGALAAGGALDVLRALSLPSAGAAAKALRDFDGAVALAPVLAAVALLDHITLGDSGIVWAVAQPAIYLLLQAATTAAGLGGVAAPTALLLRGASALAGGRALVGAISVEGSTARLAVQWGEPLVAVAALLAALIVGVHVAFGAGGRGSGEADDSSTKDSATELVRAVVEPASGLLLAMIAAHMATPEASLFELPLKYGFALSAGAVWIQAALLVGYSMLGGSQAAVPVDAIGTLDPKSANQTVRRITENAQAAVLTLLEGGLVLGCMGLGFTSLVATGASAVAAMYACATDEGRERAQKIGTVVGIGMTSCVGDFVEKRRAAAEAAAARRAAAMAEALESAEKKTNRAGGSKASDKPSAQQSVVSAPAGAQKGAKKEGSKKKNK